MGGGYDKTILIVLDVEVMIIYSVINTCCGNTAVVTITIITMRMILVILQER